MKNKGMLGDHDRTDPHSNTEVFLKPLCGKCVAKHFRCWLGPLSSLQNVTTWIQNTSKIYYCLTFFRRQSIWYPSPIAFAEACSFVCTNLNIHIHYPLNPANHEKSWREFSLADWQLYHFYERISNLGCNEWADLTRSPMLYQFCVQSLTAGTFFKPGIYWRRFQWLCSKQALHIPVSRICTSWFLWILPSPHPSMTPIQGGIYLSKACESRLGL